MAYISSEDVASIRKQVKATFPSFKFSVTKQHHSSVNVVILEGPLDFSGECSINEYYLERISNPHLRAMVDRIFEIIRTVKSVDYRETGDYGRQPNYYAHVSVGKWDKPYVCTAQSFECCSL